MKKSTAIGGAIAAMIGAATLMLPTSDNTVPVECSYTISQASAISSKVMVTMPHDEVPNATFYALHFNGSQLGISPFGDEFGVSTVSMLLNPVEDITLVVYDQGRNPIGEGNLSPGGRAVISVKEDETSK